MNRCTSKRRLTLERIAIIDGTRTPFCRYGGVLNDVDAETLGACTIKELIARTGLDPETIDEVVFGNVIQPPHATNIARILAILGGVPEHVPGVTLNRNCATGLDALIVAANKIRVGEGNVYLAGGTESLSNMPIVFSKEMKDYLLGFSKAKTLGQKLLYLLKLRPSYFKPVMPSIADPICGLSMGQTAEVLAREFDIPREEQDRFALRSQQRAVAAIESGKMAEEIAPVPLPPYCHGVQTQDVGPRADTSLESLAKLRPSFDKRGTVTAGNASQITDGACALLLMSEKAAKAQGLTPLGYITDYCYAALDPRRMGLGPAFAFSKLFQKTGLSFDQIDLIEINEAFAVQVLAVMRAVSSDAFCRAELGRDKALGEIDPDKLNVNGGAIALGHPFAASGARLALTILKELRRRGKQRGVVSLCVAGGQGIAAVVEVN